MIDRISEKVTDRIVVGGKINYTQSECEKIITDRESIISKTSTEVGLVYAGHLGFEDSWFAVLKFEYNSGKRRLSLPTRLLWFELESEDIVSALKSELQELRERFDRLVAA